MTSFAPTQAHREQGEAAGGFARPHAADVARACGDEESYRCALAELQRRIDEADAVLVGAGSGLSSAAGYNHYHWAPYFASALAPFREHYGFKSPFDGFYHLFSDYETQWGYYGAYIKAMQDAPTGAPYEHLARILAKADKPFHVLTTNIDGQCQRVFPAERITSFQGDFDFLQCSQPCCEELRDDRELVRALTANLDERLAVPSELVPRCELCGRVMVPWVRDDTFLEGAAWREGIARYQAFLDQWADGGHRLLLLELGVGEMTPGVIKLPFWALAQNVPGVFYASANLAPTAPPLQLAENSLHLCGDLARILADLATRPERAARPYAHCERRRTGPSPAPIRKTKGRPQEGEGMRTARRKRGEPV